MSDETTYIEGEIIHMEGPTVYGENGFTKLVVVVRTRGKHPQEIPVEFVQAKAELAGDKLAVGGNVRIAYDLRGREYKGRWYPSITGYRFDIDRGQTRDEPQNAPSHANHNNGDDSADSGLPF